MLRVAWILSLASQFAIRNSQFTIHSSQTIGVAANAWAQRLAARYGSQLGVWDKLHAVFRMTQPGLITQPVYYQTQLNLAPRLQLTLLAHSLGLPSATQPVPGVASEPSTPLAASAWQPIRQPVVTQRVERLVRRLQIREEQEAATAQPVTRRLAGRGERIEIVAAGNPLLRRSGPMPGQAARTDGTLLPIPLAQPVARVVRRSPVVQASAAETMPKSTNGWEKGAAFTPQTASTRPRPAEVSQVDINRITEQVVQNLDRRLLAYRERTGRV
jgi:hypothetical protein